ncbi:MAG: hypothetical protein J7L66_00070, partial [Anaerolineaceae bacterium]|nr:hypothetical protein [Anaerolineaceae bacterium]
ITLVLLLLKIIIIICSKIKHKPIIAIGDKALFFSILLVLDIEKGIFTALLSASIAWVWYKIHKNLRIGTKHFNPYYSAYPFFLVGILLMDVIG